MAANPVSVQESLRFGDFEFDPRAYQLRRSGRNLKLERIPMELLLLLVERSGELVTREQIAERIWGKGVCLDTDNSINGAIRKIRTVLKDDADEPRYIQTVAGKGYRFIALLADPDPDVARPQPNLAAQKTRSKPVVLGLLVVLALGAAAAWYLWGRTPDKPIVAGGKIMMAVLPFDNLTGDPAQDYFSDGLTEEMIARLGDLDADRLGVIARTSVMRYKNDRQPLDAIGRELGVQYVLEGSVRRDGRKVRITSQLIQMKDQTHIWARQYDRELSNLLVLQAEIAQDIARQIELTLQKGERSRAAPVVLSAASYDAYDLYLKGRYLWNKRTSEGVLQSIVVFKQAIARDPAYAGAYAGLADAYAIAGSWSYLPATEAVPLARAAALRALELDPKLAAPHACLAVIAQNHQWDWQASETHYLQAIALDPNYATARHWYAEYLALMGRFDDALIEIERARQLDPRSLIIATDKGAILYFSRQYDRAIQQFVAVKEMEPGFPRARGLLVSAYLQKQMFGEAFAELEEWKRLPDSPYIPAYAGLAYGRAGNARRAQRALRELRRYETWSGVGEGPFILANLGAGDYDRVLEHLERAYRARAGNLTALKVDPNYDPLRTDPRFQDLLRRVNLAD